MAAAARLPERVIAAATLASPAPHREDGVDWRGWVGNERFKRILTGDRYAAECEEEAQAFERTADELRRNMKDWAPPADVEALAEDMADHFVAQTSDACSSGIWGVHDDDRSFVRDWGFDPGTMPRPVVIWHGTDDTVVPVAHGRWLAEHVGGACAHLLDGEGHLSIFVRHVEHVVDELIELAASST